MTQRAVGIDVVPALTNRNRLSCAFRPILAIPHLLLVGGPIAFAGSAIWRSNGTPRTGWEGSGGVLGVVAAVVAMIAWFSILFTARYPDGLWALAAFYLRWRVRAVAYFTLLRDEYPPFGDGDYPATLQLDPPDGPRNRLTVAFRFILALPHIFLVSLLGAVWAITTAVAWIMIIITGDYPAPLYRFAVGMLRWSTRVEAYLLLLRDEYPPFSFD
jgi:hypothetical protein